jgi:hypothetical protein
MPLPAVSKNKGEKTFVEMLEEELAREEAEK